MNKEQVIDRLWEQAGHGTHREDIEAAYAAGVAACLEIVKAIHAEAGKVAHPDAEGWTKECVERICELMIARATPNVELSGHCKRAIYVELPD